MATTKKTVKTVKKVTKPVVKKVVKKAPVQKEIKVNEFKELDDFDSSRIDEISTNRELEVKDEPIDQSKSLAVYVWAAIIILIVASVLFFTCFSGKEGDKKPINNEYKQQTLDTTQLVVPDSPSTSSSTISK